MARPSEREERGFRYQKRSKEDVRERANARGGNFDSIFKAKYKVLKVKDGKNLVRILPPTWDKAKHYGYDIWVNYSIGVDNQSYLSLSRMKGEKDPIAEARREAERDGDRELVKKLNPRQRILMWVIDRNDEDQGPQLWAAPFSVDKAIAALSYDEDSGETMFIDDPDDGCDVRFYKEGQGLKTDYPPEKMRILKPTPLSEERGQAKEWLAYIQENPLPDCLQYYDYDHISNTFDGSVGGEKPDDDEEPEEKPRRKAARDEEDDEAPPPRRGRVADDEEEDAPPPRRRAAVDEDEEAEEKPARRARGKIDEDEDTDIKPKRNRADDEDDEPPRRRARVDDEDEEKPTSSVRDRLRRRVSADAEED